MLFGGELYKNCPIRARNHTSSHAKENLVETILNALGQIQKKAEEKEIFFK